MVFDFDFQPKANARPAGPRSPAAGRAAAAATAAPSAPRDQIRLEREQRRAARVEAEAAVRLTSIVRGALARIRLRRRLRDEWDGASLAPLLRFYEPRTDGERLVAFCRLLLKDPSAVACRDGPAVWARQCCRLAVLCLGAVECHNKAGTTLLRVLISLTEPAGDDPLPGRVLGALFEAGLYPRLRTLLDTVARPDGVQKAAVFVMALVTLAQRPLLDDRRTLLPFCCHILSIPVLRTLLPAAAVERMAGITDDLSDAVRPDAAPGTLPTRKQAPAVIGNLLDLCDATPSLTVAVDTLLALVSPDNTASIERQPQIFAQIQRLWAVDMVQPLLALPPLEGSASFADVAHLVKRDPALAAVPTYLPNSCGLYIRILHKFPGPWRLGVLNTMAFATPACVFLWAVLAAQKKAVLDLLVRDPDAVPQLAPLLALFAALYAHYLQVVDEREFYDDQSQFSLKAVVEIAGLCNRLLFHLYFDRPPAGDFDDFLTTSLRDMAMQLYVRDVRRSFCPPGFWTTNELATCDVAGIVAGVQRDEPDEDGSAPAAAPLHKRIPRKTLVRILKQVPHMVTFEQRALMFRHWVETERAAHPERYLATIRRQYLVEDAFAQLSTLRDRLRSTIKIQFVNAQGLDEAGIDQDGLFKELMEQLVKRMFDPMYGLFRATAERELYPSPTSTIHENHVALFEFCGRMLGKAVYEGIVLDLPFAPFFLNRLLGLYNSIDELPSLDRQLYDNLIMVKSYDGDVADLCLSFSVTDNELGAATEVPLIPGGADKDVTNATRISYVHLYAHYYLHRRTQLQTGAFVRGFQDVIRPEWLRMFRNPSELQRLISGDNVEIDVDDLRRHSRLSGYSSFDLPVIWFFSILKEFTNEERGKVLRFVTSSSRPPLLGFRYMEPPFTIHRVRTGVSWFTFRDTDKLPSASTCFNMLKLPSYNRKSTMRQKLLYAINSNAGFELS